MNLVTKTKSQIYSYYNMVSDDLFLKLKHVNKNTKHKNLKIGCLLTDTKHTVIDHLPTFYI